MPQIENINPPEAFLGISDMDAPVYRIFPVWFLEEAVRLKQLVLVRPSMWDDPFERIDDAVVVTRANGSNFEQTIQQDHPPVFAQCWSATSACDTLLRAYSRVFKDPHFSRNIHPREEGVRVQSTPRKLLNALQRAARELGNTVTPFVGRVQYMPQERILQELADLVAANGPTVFDAPLTRAQLRLKKRTEFSTEDEVRILMSCHVDRSEKVLSIAIDPNELFDEVAFDPRLASFERRERAQTLNAVGYKGRIHEWDLYARILPEIII